LSVRLVHHNNTRFFFPFARFLFSYSLTLSDSPTLSEKAARHDSSTYAPATLRHDFIRGSRTSTHVRQSCGLACHSREVKAAHESEICQVDVAAAADAQICEEKKAMTAKKKNRGGLHIRLRKGPAVSGNIGCQVFAERSPVGLISGPPGHSVLSPIPEN